MDSSAATDYLLSNIVPLQSIEAITVSRSDLEKTRSSKMDLVIIGLTFYLIVPFVLANIFSSLPNSVVIAIIALWLVLYALISVWREDTKRKTPLSMMVMTGDWLYVFLDVGMGHEGFINQYRDHLRIERKKCERSRLSLLGLILFLPLSLGAVLDLVTRGVIGLLSKAYGRLSFRGYKISVRMKGHGIIEFREASELRRGPMVSGEYSQRNIISLRDFARKYFR